MARTPQQIARRALRRLSWRWNIAAYLTRRKCAGGLVSSTDCPVAVFLRQELGDTVHTICVGHENVYLSPDITLRVPRRVRWFILDFDRGEYPQLLNS